MLLQCGVAWCDEKCHMNGCITGLGGGSNFSGHSGISTKSTVPSLRLTARWESVADSATVVIDVK